MCVQRASIISVRWDADKRKIEPRHEMHTMIWSIIYTKRETNFFFFLQKSHFQNLIRHKNIIFKISFFTKITIHKPTFRKNHIFKISLFSKITLFQASNVILPQCAPGASFGFENSKRTKIKSRQKHDSYIYFLFLII